MSTLPTELQKRVNATMKLMVERYGYCPQCAKEAVSFVSKPGA
jgi:RNA polymerase-binding transcription factor DksA